MARDLKHYPEIDCFVLVINGIERFGNATIIENLYTYQALAGGKAVWNNIIIVLTKVDFNEMEMDEESEWTDLLKEKEDLARKVIKEKFGKDLLGVIAVS